MTDLPPTPPGTSADGLPPDLPAQLVPTLRTALEADRARPVLTYLDPATGERTELSAATLDNWVAKTANLLVDDLGAEPGALVAVRLPVHWQGVAWLLAAWTAGCACVVDGSARDAPDRAVVVTTADDLDDLGGAEPVVLALRPLAVPGEGVPPGAVDYDVEVRAHGDAWTGPLPDPGAPALLEGGRARTGQQLAARAVDAGAAWGLRPGQRVAVDGAGGWDAALLPVLAGLLSGAAVLVVGGPGAGADGLERALAPEGVTALAPGWSGPAPEGSRPLAAL
ncbi:TIGR03089 family protein [Vallicoccus soli]|uniref:TIGR03089 family protein n=1 Tax=Vallicoccus soli TaxID=2339232 RepID=UPI001403F129|nr:TIGR03089 family protein [Vallicoccus soli]